MNRHSHHARLTVAGSMGLGHHPGPDIQVDWSPESRRCCGREVRLSGGDRPPVWWNDPHGWAVIPTQCGGCGAMLSPKRLSLREVRP